MNKIILVLLLAAVSTFAARESDNIVESSAYGEKVVTESPNSGIGEYQSKEHFRREAILNFIIHNNAQNNAEYTATKASLIDVVDQNVSGGGATPIVRMDNNLTVAGYCLIRDDILVGKQPGAGKFICNTNIGQLEIFGNLTPVNETSTLIYDPAYIEFKNWRYRVIRSRVLNEAKTTYNIATYVNDRKLAEIALTATSNSADVIKTQSSDYLSELKESRRRNTTEYVTVGNGANSYIAPIQNQNTEKPNAMDYVTKAAIDITAGIVKNTAEIFKKDLPYLYEIVGGSRIYIDLVIDKKGEKIQ